MRVVIFLMVNLATTFVESVDLFEYSVKVVISDSFWSGTSDTVSIKIFGSAGETNWITLNKVEFSRDSVVILTVRSDKDVNVLCGITLNKPGNDGWKPVSIAVTGPGGTTATFDFDYEMDDNKSHRSEWKTVNGGWSDWGDFSLCKKCGGSQTRHRHCNKPVPICGGANCTGSASETVECPAGFCPFSSGLPKTSTQLTKFKSSSQLSVTTLHVTRTNQFQFRTTATPSRQPSLTIPLAGALSGFAVIVIVITMIVVCRYKRKEKSHLFIGQPLTDVVPGDEGFAETSFNENLYVHDDIRKPIATVQPIPLTDVKFATQNSAKAKTPSQALVESVYYNDVSNTVSTLPRQGNIYENTGFVETNHSNNKSQPTELEQSPELESEDDEIFSLNGDANVFYKSASPKSKDVVHYYTMPMFADINAEIGESNYAAVDRAITDNDIPSETNISPETNKVESSINTEAERVYEVPDATRVSANDIVPSGHTSPPHYFDMSGSIRGESHIDSNKSNANGDLWMKNSLYGKR